MRRVFDTEAESLVWPALAALALAACVSLDTELRAARESWRGATHDEVVAAWGQPAQSGRDSHTWRSEDRPPNTGPRVGVGIGMGSGRVGVGIGAGGALFGGSGEAVRCDRTLVFRDKRVSDENWSGDPEFCKRFARRK